MLLLTLAGWSPFSHTWSHNFHDTTLWKSCSSVFSNKTPPFQEAEANSRQFRRWPLSFTQDHFHISAPHCKLTNFLKPSRQVAHENIFEDKVLLLSLWKCYFQYRLYFSSWPGPRSSSTLLRTVWWRITPRGRPLISSWNTRSSETSRTRGRSASSSRTTSTTRARRGGRKVRFYACSWFSHTPWW